MAPLNWVVSVVLKVAGRHPSNIGVPFFCAGSPPGRWLSPNSRWDYCLGGTVSVLAFDCVCILAFSADSYELRIASKYAWYSLLRYPSASFCF